MIDIFSDLKMRKSGRRIGDLVVKREGDAFTTTTTTMTTGTFEAVTRRIIFANKMDWIFLLIMFLYLPIQGTILLNLLSLVTLHMYLFL